MNLYLTHSGRLRRSGNTLSFERIILPDNEILYTDEECDSLDELPIASKHSLPIETTNAVYLFGEITLNTKLLNFLAQKKVPLHTFNWYGHHTGTFLPHADQLSGDLVIRQSEAYKNDAERLEICREILSATFYNIRSVLSYYARRKTPLTEEIEQIDMLYGRLNEALSPAELMGIEGSVRRIYYSCWHKWLGSNAQNFKRVYHPPDNPLNATISFVNSLLYTACVSELYRTALYPGISYLHTPQTRRFSLALDLVEPFKPVMADRLIFRLWNSHSITDKDFMSDTNGFILTDDARKKILTEWDSLLRTTLHVDSLNRSVSYRQLLRLDCYKLINYLFEHKAYKPYRAES